MRTYEGTLKQRFHRDVRNLKKFCEKNNLYLLLYEDANDNDICVLSERDYEIGATKPNCEEGRESYFLSQHNYELYQDYINEEV